MKKDIDSLILQALAGTASPEDLEDFNRWLAESEDNKKLFNELKSFWERPAPHSKMINEEEIRDQIWEAAHRRMVQKRKRQTGFWYSTAAAIFLVAIGSLFLYHNLSPSKTIISAVPTVTKTAPRGVKSTIMLPDGTKVILNSESSLRYAQGFTDSVRWVELTGEAYFDVASNKKKPFEVKAKGVTTTVLGTLFNVRAYPDDPAVEVALLEGKLSVSGKADPAADAAYLLQPGEFVSVENDSIVSKGAFDPASVFGWKDGLLIFKKADFMTIVEKLERWYGVSFVYEEKPSDWQFDGKFDNAYLENVLDVLSHSESFKYNFKNDTVKIYFQ